MFSFRRHLFGSLPLIAAAAFGCGGESLVVPTTGTLQAFVILSSASAVAVLQAITNS